jgi:hypothetical protein
MSETNKPAHDATPDAVPPAPADRGAVLAEAIARVKAMPGYPRFVLPEEMVAELCRLADEAPQPEAQARRGDSFEQWLTAQRDDWGHKSPPWTVLDDALDLYRLHADTGTPLGEHVCMAQAVGDCDCLEQPSATEAAEGAQR